MILIRFARRSPRTAFYLALFLLQKFSEYLPAFYLTFICRSLNCDTIIYYTFFSPLSTHIRKRNAEIFGDTHKSPPSPPPFPFGGDNPSLSLKGKVARRAERVKSGLENNPSVANATSPLPGATSFVVPLRRRNAKLLLSLKGKVPALAGQRVKSSPP